jgi:site-specific DNA-methyltransferase (adenine-specific)
MDSGFYNMDCMEGMKQFPDKFFDLVITSPPYNLGKQHHTGNNRFTAYNTFNDNMPENEYQKWQIKVLNEIHRIIKDDGSVFYNHKNRIRNALTISPYEWINKSSLLLKQELIWFNGSQNFDKCRFYPMTEKVFWLSKTKETLFTNNINHHDLFNWKAEGTNGEHKRAFPIEMVYDILSCFPKGLKVLDPFMGSGTTGIACHKLGFEFWGFELDPDYYALATDRLEAVKAQMTFFD